MDIRTKEIYSEVYEILILLGDRFIDRLPNKLFDLIKKEKLDSYNPQYDLNLPLEGQKIKEETIDMIALFYLNYWCESEEEKKELNEIFQQNEEKYQKELKEKYNPDNLFKNKQIEKQENQEVSIIEYKKSIFRRIIDRIKFMLGIN